MSLAPTRSGSLRCRLHRTPPCGVCSWERRAKLVIPLYLCGCPLALPSQVAVGCRPRSLSLKAWAVFWTVFRSSHTTCVRPGAEALQPLPLGRGQLKSK